MYSLENNLIGGYYPFFTTNTNLEDGGYVYQTMSPTYNKTTLKPYFSMTKVCDRTFAPKGEKIVSRDVDVIYNTLDEQYIESLKNEEGVIDRSRINWVAQVKKLVGIKGTRVLPLQPRESFPMVEINGYDIDIQKNLILNLRYMVKWRKYRIKPGEKVDILWTKNQFLVCGICSHPSGGFQLEPIGLYMNNDIAMKDNLLRPGLIDVASEEDLVLPKRVQDFLEGIKSIEAKCFDVDEIKL